MWKTIDANSCYEVNEEGTIREKRTGKIVNQYYDKDGYLLVNLQQKLYRVHRLVCIAFLPNPYNYPVVNHKNFKKDDNRLSNLEWCSYCQNAKHSFTNHHRDASVKKWKKEVQKLAAEKSKTPIIQYTLDGEMVAIYSSQREASEKSKINRTCITMCVNGRRKTAGGFIWKYTEE